MTNQKPNATSVFTLGLIISMIIWGAAWPAGKVLAAYGTVSNVLITRFILVVLSMLPFLFWFKIDFKIQKTGWFHVAMAGSLMAIYSYFFLKGLQTGLAGAGGVLVTTLNPIFAYSIGLIMQKRLPNRKETIGLFLGVLAGMVLLQIWKKYDEIFSSGNIYFLLAAFIWAAMSKFSSKAASYGHSISFSLWIYVITVFLLFFSVDFSALKQMWMQADVDFWMLMFYTSAIGTSLATSIYFLATTKLGAERASSFIFIVPFSAAISSWIFLDETIKLHTIIGGMLGILAVLVLNSNFGRLKKT